MTRRQIRCCKLWTVRTSLTIPETAVNETTLDEILLRASRCRIVCLGDIMLDRFVYGSVSRISPEAPIPVLAHEREVAMPGAVGNVAANVAALGAMATVLSVAGDDPAADELIGIMSAAARLDHDLVRSSMRQTTQKTRFVAGGQQVMRLDVERTDPLGEVDRRALTDRLEHALEGAACLVVSDYAKGCVSAELMLEAVRIAKARGVATIVDPKGRDFRKYGPVDLIKPNAAELREMTGLPTTEDKDVELALKVALDRSEAESILVTRAGRGLTFMSRDIVPHHLRGEAVEVYDVSGAGDTSLAGLAVGLAAGATLRSAAELALTASRIAVTKRGTATVTADEVRSARRASSVDGAMPSTSALTLTDAVERVRKWKAAGLRVGFTNGCFDILHPGHVKVLETARAACDRLVVGLNSDASVRGLKGPERPVNPAEVRARMLLALSAVDEVVIFGEQTPITVVTALVPDVLVKGGDYSEATIVGAEFVRASGGEILIVPLAEGQSTTAIISRLKQDQ